jgi:hypothetical protein
MNDKTGPIEPVVVIPLGMDCRVPMEYFMLTKSISLKEMKELYPSEHLSKNDHD